MTDSSREDVIRRLRKVEGQVRGVQRMIEQRKDCSEVVHQLSAARKALDKVGFMILSHRMQECISDKPAGKDAQQAMDEALKLFLTLA